MVIAGYCCISVPSPACCICFPVVELIFCKTYTFPLAVVNAQRRAWHGQLLGKIEMCLSCWGRFQFFSTQLRSSGKNGSTYTFNEQNSETAVVTFRLHCSTATTERVALLLLLVSLYNHISLLSSIYTHSSKQMSSALMKRTHDFLKIFIICTAFFFLFS